MVNAATAKEVLFQLKEQKDGSFIDMVKKTLDGLCLAKLQTYGLDAQKIKEVADESLYGSKSFSQAMKKLTERCSTIDELENLSSYISERQCHRKCYEDSNRIDTSFITEKINSVIFAEVPKTEDPQLLKKYYNRASRDSAARILAFEKWLEQCRTPQEADEVFKEAQKNKMDKCLLKVYEKVKELSYNNQST
jgi:hypothetical protein